MKICFDRYGKARVQKNNTWEFNNGYHGSAFISKKWDGYNVENGKVQVLNAISGQIYELDTDDEETMDAFYREFKSQLQMTREQFDLLINVL